MGVSSLLIVAASLVVGGSKDLGRNIIPNGDFSQGNVGFKCQLHYEKPAIDCLWGANYTVAATFNKIQLHHLIAPDAFSSPIKKTSHEQVLFANAGGVEPVVMWMTEVKVQPNTRYLLSYSTTSLSGYKTDGIPPHQVSTIEWASDFEIWANDESSVPITAGLGTYTKGQMYWNSKKATTAVIKIVRTRFEHGGGLYGLTDILMVPVKG